MKTTGVSATGLTTIPIIASASLSASGITGPFATSSTSSITSAFSPTHSYGLSAGAIVSIAIGVAIAVIAALLVCVVFAFRYSARKKSEKKPEGSERPPTDYEMYQFFNGFNIQRNLRHNKRA